LPFSSRFPARSCALFLRAFLRALESHHHSPFISK
jgi:hypothetical protein